MGADYGELAGRLQATQVISDPWIGGRERFRQEPQRLKVAIYEELCRVAEGAGEVWGELGRVVAANPRLLDEYYGLTSWQKAMWLSSEGRWHGIARVDLFVCDDGRVRVCEMNSDTPSGEAEAVLLNRLLAPTVGGLTDPNEGFEDRFRQMLEVSWRARGGRGRVESIGIVYPTDMPEDLSMIAIYGRWLEAHGSRVVLGSPYNLGEVKGRVTVMGEGVDLILRHYKTDWWGERQPIRRDQDEWADAEPLERELSIVLRGEMEGRVTVVNPFGSVVTQNKLSMALMWERRELFSRRSREWIERYLPETRRMTELNPGGEKQEEWVLKSVYGCEGDSVICGRFVDQKVWREALEMVIPRHWVAQRFFVVRPEADGLLANYGVYLIGGRAAGVYTRLSREATDETALTVATFVIPRSGDRA